LIDLLQFEFIRNAIFASILSSIACGIIGCYIIVKRLVFISGGISHTAFGGIGLGYLLGVNPIYTITPFSLAAAISIALLSKKTKVYEDTAIGIFWALGMALGIILIGFSDGYAPDLMGYLFGNILTVPLSDIFLMITLDIIIVLTVMILYQEFLAICFDEEYAETQGVKTLSLYIILLCLISLTIVILIKIVGIILVISLLTIPAAISQQITYNLKKMMLLSIVLGIIFTLGGLIISYNFNLASGATIVLMAGSFYFIILALKYLLKLNN
jgi:zinc transport system permease protein